MRRYQVKVKRKGWTAPGPDLLRTHSNAIGQTVEMLPDRGPWYWRKLMPSDDWTPWREVGNRREVTEWLAIALPTLNDGQIAQLGRGDGQEARVVLRAREIVVPDLYNATPAAETTHALVRAAFPDVKFAGCYVCKRYNGSTDPRVGFSDHAWGDAVDETENPEAGVRNDDVTDWCVRMAKEGLLPVVQIIGSVRGEATSFEAPDWTPDPGADASHEWHVHLSCTRHSGIPPCAKAA